jgi:hypothetical protein
METLYFIYHHEIRKTQKDVKGKLSWPVLRSEHFRSGNRNSKQTAFQKASHHRNLYVPSSLQTITHPDM